MDFTLSKQHEMARSLFREFAEKEVKPLAIEVDETEEFPRETVEKIVTDIMENTYKLSVPLKVEINEGKNWYDAK